MPELFNASEWLVDRNLAEGRGANTAVIADGAELTYTDLLGEVHRGANALLALDVRAEERVPLVLSDTAAFPALFLGAMRLGAVPVPLSTMLTGKELGAVVHDTRARVLAISAAYADRLPALLDGAPAVRHVVVVGTEDGDQGAGVDTGGASGVEVVAWAACTDHSEVPVAPTWPDSPGFWLYTSGTTGLPKGAMHRHIDLKITADTYASQVLGVTAQDRCYSVAKLFFAYGLGNSLTFPFAAGATAILDSRPPSPATVAETCAKHRPTLFFASPGFLAATLDAQVPVEALASARAGVTAGEALPAELHRRFTEHYGFPVLDGIGSTELLHIFVSNRFGAERPGTSGTPVPDYEVKLLDDAGDEVTAHDTPGYLYVKGASAAMGYWCRTEATRAAFAGEWMRTGDVYTHSADGYWTFLGRNNDMIKAGGIWVSPAEVENALIEHPEVLEAAVVGARNADGLETTVAFVVPRAGATVAEAAIDAHCRERLASFKRPRRVLVVDMLPKTATGKVQRYVLREQLADRPAGDEPVPA